MQKQMLWKEVVHVSKISSQKTFLRKIARSKNVKKQEQLKLNVRGSTLWSLGGLLLHLCPPVNKKCIKHKPVLKLLKER